MTERPAGEKPTQGTELRTLLSLSASLGFVHVGYNLTGFVDTVLAGRVGGVTVAATGLGSHLFMAVSILGVGIVLGLEPILAQAFGAGQLRFARSALWQGFYLGGMVTVPLSVVVLAVAAGLPLLGHDAKLASETFSYLVGRLPSLWPLLACVAIRLYLQATHKTRPIVVAVVGFNLFNLAADWVLLFGDPGLVRLGLPAIGLSPLGVAGIGWSSTVATLGQLAVLAHALDGVAPGSGDEPIRRLDAAVVRRAVMVGGPLGLQLAAEIGIFTLVALLMGRIGTTVLASHQVALQWASLTFAVSLGVGSAAAVEVGRAIGRQDHPGTRRAGFSAIAIGAAFMGCAALVMWTWPEGVARFVTSDESVIPGAVTLILIAAVFQVVDGVQAVAGGALRGAGVTRFTFVAHLVGHWAIGLPVGAFLAYVVGMGGAGLWWGLTVGLAVVAVTLALKFAHLSREPIARLSDR